jgi:hypothetical protein
MRKEAQTAYNGLKLIVESLLKLKKSKPDLFKRSEIKNMPEALHEHIRKSNPKMSDDIKAFLLYFNGNLVEYISGDYAGPDADIKAAAEAAYDGLKALETAANYLTENKPDVFTEQGIEALPEAVLGFIIDMKYKISDPARKFLDEFLGFISFNLTKGFIQYDPVNKNKPRQMELF